MLIIKNRLNINNIKIEDDLERFKDYEKERTGRDINFTIIESDFDLTHKEFGVLLIKDTGPVQAWGLDGIKEKIRERFTIPENFFNCCVFLYDLDQTTFDRKTKNIAHWAYFSELVSGTEFIEIACTKKWDKGKDVLRVLTHEIRHADVFRARRRGIPMVDVMDRTPVDGVIVPYYKEFQVFAKDGNRARQIELLKPIIKTIDSKSIFDVIIGTIKVPYNEFIKSIKSIIMQTPKPPQKESKLNAWADAIKQFEGWFVGSRSYRNLNPGNLRYSKYEIGKDGGYSLFRTYNDGWKALLHQLTIAATGKSKVYKPDDTLLDFFKKYAPSSDNNHPETYAKFVAKKIGVDITTKIKELI